MKYEIDLHLFSEKLRSILLKKNMRDKKGNPDKVALYNTLYAKDKITEEDCKKDRQNVTDKTRKIDNWIKGKNYPSNISDILSLCNALDCDLDYFFTHMKPPTHDLEFISNETGLSDISINELKKCNDMQLDIFNRLIETGHISKLIDAFIDYSPMIGTPNSDNGDLSFNEYKILKAIEILLKQIFADTDFCKKVNHYKTGQMREYYAQYADEPQASDTEL